jgi:hypothetical protein
LNSGVCDDVDDDDDDNDDKIKECPRQCLEGI